MQIWRCEQIDNCEQIVLHNLQRYITHLAVITRKTNIKLGVLKKRTGKKPRFVLLNFMLYSVTLRVQPL